MNDRTPNPDFVAALNAGRLLRDTFGGAHPATRAAVLTVMRAAPDWALSELASLACEMGFLPAPVPLANGVAGWPVAALAEWLGVPEAQMRERLARIHAAVGCATGEGLALH